MKKTKLNWKEDGGSIDFIQVIIGLMIVSIACVGTFKALDFGYKHLNEQMRYRKALCVARAYVEYWQGRIHTDFDANDQVTRAGNLGRGEWVLLDKGDPGTSTDDISCNVSYGKLDPVDLVVTGVGIDYWKIRVYVKWWELNQSRAERPYQIFFDATMVPAAL
jgi:hypothetical protein